MGSTKLAGDSGAALMEMEFGGSAEEVGRLLESQRELFGCQVDHLERIVVEQCKLTGANPLSQEMAAGALSINIGKRPRDLMNPKAVKYMQSVFSIKDTISKKDTREISALCGVTATQVREFFSGQRSRVRTFVRLSREKADELKPVETLNDACSVESGLDMPVYSQNIACTADVKIVKVEENHHNIITDQRLQAVRSEETLKDVKSEACSLPEESLPDLDSSEKHFVENIFVLMEKESAFSGQEKLLEWILRIHNAAVSIWFLNKGGLTIITTWLSQAVIEEQTSVLFVILKVLSHLPLHKALPVQMSAILQTVNKLRFYRTSDISNRAKALLSKWSKMLVRSQALKKLAPSKATPDTMEEMLHKQRINQILGDEAHNSKMEMPDDFLALTYDTLDSSRTSETAGSLKMLPAPSTNSSKSLLQSVPRSYTRERRKILVVENPDFKTASRNSTSTRLAQANNSRPLSADDIQKAKMRAIYMKTKYGEIDTKKEGVGNRNDNKHSAVVTDDDRLSPCSNAVRMLSEESIEIGKDNVKLMPAISNETSVKFEKAVDLEAHITSQKSHLVTSSSLSKSTPGRNILKEDTGVNSCSPLKAKENVALQKRLQLNVSTERSEIRTSVTHNNSHMSSRSDAQWNQIDKLKKSEIPWCTPPVLKINSSWNMCSGEDSKEVDVQSKRTRREKETAYFSAAEIPSDPKEPWDVEMDYDDSLTPEIPTEQPQEVDASEAASCSRSNLSSSNNLTTVQSTPPEPDLELLAVLLKNPDLVFALTSGQTGNVPNTQMLQVLDLLKNSGMGLAGLVSKLKGTAEVVVKPPLAQTAPASLPSPTPPSDPVMRWKLDPPPAPDALESTVVSSRLLFNQISNGRPGDILSGAERLAGRTSNLIPQAHSSAQWPNQGRPSSQLPYPSQHLSVSANGREPYQLTGSHSLNGLAFQSTSLKSDPVSNSSNHPFTDISTNGFLPPVVAKNYPIPIPARQGETSHFPSMQTSRSGNIMHQLPLTGYSSRAYDHVSNNTRDPNLVTRQTAYGQHAISFSQTNTYGGGNKLLDQPEFESWSPERDRTSNWRSSGQNYGRGNSNPYVWRRPNSGQDQR